MKNFFKYSALALLGLFLISCSKPSDSSKTAQAGGDASKTATADGSSSDVKPVNLKLGHGLPVGHPVHKAMEFFAQKVSDKTNGKLTISIYPAEQLGDEAKLVELVKQGGVDMTKTGAVNLEAYDPKFGVASMPYLFQNRQQMLNFMKGDTGRKFMDMTDAIGFKSITLFDAGSRNFYLHKAIATVDDLKGLKIRTRSNQTEIATVQAFGAAPTPISYGELYSALQQSVVDGAENNIPSYVTSRHMEVAKFFINDAHSMSPDLLYMNLAKYQSLDPSFQKAIMDAGKEALDEEIKLWEEYEKTCKQQAIDQGSTFVDIDDSSFRKAVEPMYQNLDPAIQAVIDSIKSTPTS